MTHGRQNTEKLDGHLNDGPKTVRLEFYMAEFYCTDAFKKSKFLNTNIKKRLKLCRYFKKKVHSVAKECHIIR